MPDIVTRSIAAAPDVLLELHASKPDRYPAFLESAAQGGELGRYDILFAYPQREISAASGLSFLAALDAAWRAELCVVLLDAIPRRLVRVSQLRARELNRSAVAASDSGPVRTCTRAENSR